MQHIERRGTDFGTECLYANGVAQRGMELHGLDPISAGQELSGAILELPPVRVYSTPPESKTVDPKAQRDLDLSRGAIPAELINVDPVGLQVAGIFAADQALVPEQVAMSEEKHYPKEDFGVPREIEEDLFGDNAWPHIYLIPPRRTRIKRSPKD